MIIDSLLDTDFYKFTMAQVVFHHFPEFVVDYTFKCRSDDIEWTKGMFDDIAKEINSFCTLTFKQDELNYLRKIRYLKSDFIDALSLYKPSRMDVHPIGISFGKTNELSLGTSGLWFNTIWFEVPILAIVNEVYFRHTTDFEKVKSSGQARMRTKLKILEKNKINVTEFGTRRRYSKEWQKYVVGSMMCDLSGTSNVQLAQLYRLTPIGTMAHEYIMAGQAITHVKLVDSQKYMFQKWIDEYRGELGIALTDTYGYKKFLKDFDLYFSKLYDGVRHDSGDPFVWAEDVIEHYRKMKIDPRTKTLVFSDGLDFDKILELNKRFKRDAKLVFGVGTNLTNDFAGVKPLQIVMKMTKCNGSPVVKISDSPGKTMCKGKELVEYIGNIMK